MAKAAELQRRARAPAAPAAGRANIGGLDPEAEPRRGVSLADGVRSAAQAGNLGELFQFTIDRPVDLPRRRSAMFPIVHDPVSAEKVSIYNQSVQARHPLHGVYLSNDTKLKLPGGPITVFDGRAYAGDAQIEHLSPGDKRLLSYGIDLAVTVDPSVHNTSRFVSARIVRGVLEITHLQTFSQTYLVKNKADTPRQIVVEHPFHAARRLIEPASFEEKTPSVYRFRVPVEPAATVKFDVREEQPLVQGIAILDQPLPMLLRYAQTGEISQAVKDALAKAIQLRQEQAALEQRLNDLRAQLQELKQGQDRLRKNIETVGRDSNPGKQYIEKLVAQEKQIEQMEQQIEELRKQIEAKRDELAEYVRDLNVNG